MSCLLRPTVEWAFSVEKGQKWRTAHPEGVACPTPSSVGPIFAGRGWVILGRLANKFRSRFGTNTKLFRGVIGPISALNDYLNAVFDDVISLCGSCSNNALPRSQRKMLQLVVILSLRVISLSLTMKEYAICKSLRQIETYSPAMDS